MRIIVPVTMFGSVPPVLFTSGVLGRDCIIYCTGHNIWLRFLVLLFPPNVSSSRFPGQVRRRVGDLSLFRVWSVLNWCTVLVTILVCANAVRSQAHSSCLILACEM